MDLDLILNETPINVCVGGRLENPIRTWQLYLNEYVKTPNLRMTNMTLRTFLFDESSILFIFSIALLHVQGTGCLLRDRNFSMARRFHIPIHL